MIFLDVGANTGQTLEKVLRHPFTRIVCFEPAPPCWKTLEVHAALDPRVEVVKFGLYDRTDAMPLYEPGRKGASLWRKSYARSTVSLICEFVRASDWFRANISGDEPVWLKLNCEGSECDILEDLIMAGEMRKVTHLMVQFHGDKIPELKDHAESLIERLRGRRMELSSDVDAWLEATV